MAATMVLPQTLIHLNNKSESDRGRQPNQKATITIKKNHLKEPYILSIDSQTEWIDARIDLNGEVLQELTNRSTRINLSSLLQPGKNTIEISGEYGPTESTVTVELQGPDTRVNHQTTGSGKLDGIVEILVE